MTDKRRKRRKSSPLALLAICLLVISENCVEDVDCGTTTEKPTDEGLEIPVDDIKNVLGEILRSEARKKHRLIAEAKHREEARHGHLQTHVSVVRPEVADDPGLPLPMMKRRKKRSSITEFGQDERSAMLDEFKRDEILPREPLSYRVADDEEGAHEGRDSFGKKHRERKKHKHKHHRRHHQHHRHKRESIADEDLYDLFMDYFAGGGFVSGSSARSKRSVTLDNNPIQDQRLELGAFPEADRVNNDHGHHVEHIVRSELLPPPPQPPPGQRPPNMLPLPPGPQRPQQTQENRLTHQDIKDVTRNTDLGQILRWLEALSQGREHDVTAALLVAKKKRRQSSSSVDKKKQREDRRAKEAAEAILHHLPEDHLEQMKQHGKEIVLPAPSEKNRAAPVASTSSTSPSVPHPSASFAPTDFQHVSSAPTPPSTSTTSPPTTSTTPSTITISPAKASTKPAPDSERVEIETLSSPREHRKHKKNRKRKHKRKRKGHHSPHRKNNHDVHDAREHDSSVERTSEVRKKSERRHSNNKREHDEHDGGGGDDGDVVEDGKMRI